MNEFVTESINKSSNKIDCKINIFKYIICNDDIKTLIFACNNFNLSNFEKKELIIFAAKKDSLESVKFFKDTVTKDAVYCAITCAAQDNSIKTIKYLFEFCEEETINLAFHIASGYGHLDLVKFFVENKIDINSENGYALRIAIHYNNYDVVQYLLENGADIAVLDNAPIKKAIYLERDDIVKLLEKFGAIAEVN